MNWTELLHTDRNEFGRRLMALVHVMKNHHFPARDILLQNLMVAAALMEAEIPYGKYVYCEDCNYTAKVDDDIQSFTCPVCHEGVKLISPWMDASKFEPPPKPRGGSVHVKRQPSGKLIHINPM